MLLALRLRLFGEVRALLPSSGANRGWRFLRNSTPLAQPQKETLPVRLSSWLEISRLGWLGPLAPLGGRRDKRLFAAGHRRGHALFGAGKLRRGKSS